MAQFTASLSPQLVFESPHGSGANLLVKLHSACGVAVVNFGF